MALGNQQNNLIQHILDDENEEMREEKIQLLIDVDSINSKTVFVGPGDNAVNLAKKFCYDHNVDPRIIQDLAKNIRAVQTRAFEKKSQPNADAAHRATPQQQAKDKDKAKHNLRTSDCNLRESGINIRDSRHNVREEQKRRSSECFMRRNDEQNNELNANRVMNAQQLSRVKYNKNSRYENSYYSNQIGQRESILEYQYENKIPTVFERLYNDFKVKKRRQKENTNINININTNINKSMNTNYNTNIINTNKKETNNGVGLYERNRRLHENTRKRNEQLREQKQKEQLRQCRMKPQINKISSMIVSRYECNSRMRSENRVSNNIKEYLKSKEAEEMSQCTFKPKLCHNKSYSSHNKTNIERYLLLHQDYLIRKHKFKQHSHKNTFKPAINNISKYIIGNKSFTERLQYDLNLRKNKSKSYQNLQLSLNHHIPSTGRSPLNRNRGKLNIGEYLYLQTKKKHSSNEKQHQNVTCKKSNLIYENNKKSAFRYLFALMDSNNDGLISSAKIQLSTIPMPILKIITPLLIQMEEVGIELNEDQFIQSIERLFKTLNVSERSVILNSYRHEVNRGQQYSFQPRLNERSMQIANSSRRNLYDIWKDTQLIKEQRLSDMKAQKQLQQFEECTFHPVLYR